MKQISFAKTKPTLLQKAEGSGYPTLCEMAPADSEIFGGKNILLVVMSYYTNYRSLGYRVFSLEAF